MKTVIRQAPAAEGGARGPAPRALARRSGARARHPAWATLLSLASLGWFAPLQACARPTAAAAAPASTTPLSSVADALSHHRERYEVGWLTASGEVAYSDVTAVSVEPSGSVRLELAEPSLIWGTAGSRTLEGHWQDSTGTGELWLEFDGDYSSARGWWSNGGSSQRRELWLRLSAEDPAAEAETHAEPAPGH